MHLPFFTLEHKSHQILNKSHQYQTPDKDDYTYDFAHRESHPYTYTLKNQTVQARTATITQEKRVWARKWFPFLKHVQHSIDIKFDGEVGERTGSYKGGVIGTSQEMLPNETPLQTLRRMEATREFK